MIPILLWVLGCYALAAAAVHGAFRFSRSSGREEKHYVLLAGNEQRRMEWYLRALRRYSGRTGREVRVTVVDRGSEDETMDITRFFTRQGMNVNIAAGGPYSVNGGSLFNGAYDFGPVAGHGVNDSGGPIEDRVGAGRIRAKRGERRRRFTLWRRFRQLFSAGKSGEVRVGAGRHRSSTFEPTHLLWMLQVEGIVTEPEHAVLIDLQKPDDLSKLPL